MSDKSLRVSATTGNEETAKENYSAIRRIAKEAAKLYSITMDDVINYMTTRISNKTNKKLGLRAGSFNNYCRTGIVSESICHVLYEFFEEKVPYTVFSGKTKIKLEHMALIFSILMHRLNQSNITSKKLGEKDGTGFRYYWSNDFLDMFVNAKHNNLFQDNDDDLDNIETLLSSMGEIEALENSFEEDEDMERYNEEFIYYGLDPIIHSNQELISLIMLETLWSFDLDKLKECYESYKGVAEIFESVIRAKEIKEKYTM